MIHSGGSNNKNLSPNLPLKSLSFFSRLGLGSLLDGLNLMLVILIIIGILVPDMGLGNSHGAGDRAAVDL